MKNRPPISSIMSTDLITLSVTDKLETAERLFKNNKIRHIPVTDNTERVTVNALIVPMLGFDIKGYRLGYGAGYYDRTISGMNPRPLLIGVAFEILRLEDIYPRPHDVAMDFIVTEAGIFQVSKQGISRISTDKCALENS